MGCDGLRPCRCGGVESDSAEKRSVLPPTGPQPARRCFRQPAQVCPHGGGNKNNNKTRRCLARGKARPQTSGRPAGPRERERGRPRRPLVRRPARNARVAGVWVFYDRPPPTPIERVDGKPPSTRARGQLVGGHVGRRRSPGGSAGLTMPAVLEGLMLAERQARVALQLPVDSPRALEVPSASLGMSKVAQRLPLQARPGRSIASRLGAASVLWFAGEEYSLADVGQRLAEFR